MRQPIVTKVNALNSNFWCCCVSPRNFLITGFKKYFPMIPYFRCKNCFSNTVCLCFILGKRSSQNLRREEMEEIVDVNDASFWDHPALLQYTKEISTKTELNEIPTQKQNSESAEKYCNDNTETKENPSPWSAFFSQKRTFSRSNIKIDDVQTKTPCELQPIDFLEDAIPLCSGHQLPMIQKLITNMGPNKGKAFW
ncbi:hypothetical protein RFI_24990 [Reticulomyxa filosa]|uniref:Uncharacterized protein n=1 Tax=Reticulomyxa filosa TaxID=46433 RepID=X6MFI3_RETFI|nr:hypothetical protein RFI_24990 [Reticulomyxa filosa]|eukprot:ETO12386.1 hypothetical protein RFI_24990 [Reticulomyxa filosa]